MNIEAECINCCWQPGIAPVAVVMISLNEGHNMEAVLQNLSGWAQEVFLVDSCSKDDTVDIALRYGVHVVQKRFQGFGDQWNFALRELPIQSKWTMKLDPDERLSDELKANLIAAIDRNEADGFTMIRRLWFMGKPLQVHHSILRLWRTGSCRFTDIAVNEHPLVKGCIMAVKGEMAHYDSPDLDHWLEKQNHYTTAEALIAYNDSPLADKPLLLGTAFQKRMWLKKNFKYIPFRFGLIFLHSWIWSGAWKAGWTGYAWARLRSYLMRLREYKIREIEITGHLPEKQEYGAGEPDKRVKLYD